MLEENEFSLTNDENVPPIFIHGLQTNGDHRSDKDFISNLLRDVFSPELIALEPVVEVKRRTKIEGDKVVRSFEVRLAQSYDRQVILRNGYQLRFSAATKNVYITEDNETPVAWTAQKSSAQDHNVKTVLVCDAKAASEYQKKSGGKAIRFVCATKEKYKKVSQSANEISKLAEPTKRRP